MIQLYIRIGFALAMLVAALGVIFGFGEADSRLVRLLLEMAGALLYGSCAAPLRLD